MARVTGVRMKLLASTGHNLRNIARFSGRESGAQFWPYAIIVVLLVAGAIVALLLPEMSQAMAKAARFAAEHPDQATIESAPGSFSITIHGNHPELMPDFAMMSRGVAAITIVAVALLAAAVARRLHDRDRSGLWGVLPLPFLAFAIVMMPRIAANFAAGAPDFGLFFALFFNNLAYLVSLFVLIALLAGKATPGDNRFGREPAR
jgi:uncharacterized membrane protein YhaH (DUF805 family)